ncbi:hypothetical protein [Gordonia sp. 'Campus']|uniref:hypothetical protein n=1 Tax=Gordonia sp. 'Campus' TaxID=2915824 RepID=UPI001EE4178B|nr:hypothetical protein [Gordonia sp. 'Campus']
MWRSLYCADTPLACYLEVLAFARPSPQLIAELDDITVDDEDDELYPAVPPGQVARSWCEARILGRGALTGRFAVPADLDTLRLRFRPLAIRYGLYGLDTAALRDGRPPRPHPSHLTVDLRPTRPAGRSRRRRIEFDSRHGDHLRMWALYERAADPDISPHVHVVDHCRIDPIDPDLTRHRMVTLDCARVIVTEHNRRTDGPSGHTRTTDLRFETGIAHLHRYVAARGSSSPPHSVTNADSAPGVESTAARGGVGRSDPPYRDRIPDWRWNVGDAMLDVGSAHLRRSTP